MAKFDYDPSEAIDCLPNGEYDAELSSVTVKTSKAGNSMLEVIWTVPVNGRNWKVKDFVVNPSTLYRLKRIAKAFGKADDFELGVFDLEEYIGRTLRVGLEVETSEAYGDQNKVTHYRNTPYATSSAPKEESDIPF